MAAFNHDGFVVNIGDSVSILGEYISQTGSGPTAVITVQPPLAPVAGRFTCQANDCQSTDDPNDSSHTATSISGQYFGVAGEQISVLGVVTAISGSGNTASLTVTLKSSGNSITVPAGATHSAT